MTMIPFNKPYFTGKELTYLQEAVAASSLGANNSFTQRCESAIRQLTAAPGAVLTNSCTAALEMAAILIDAGPGDEIIMPSFTFPSTASAFVLRGARPIFVDIRPDTLNIDEGRIEAAITSRTKAIVVVHYAGTPCEMEPIISIARRHALFLIEDAAQAFLSRYGDRAAGTMGDLSTYSFHATKNISCGEGGALVVNSDDLLKRAWTLRDKGTNRQAFIEGRVKKYSWIGLGTACAPGELPAAHLLAQLEQAEQITSMRREGCDRYRAALAPLEQQGLLTLPAAPKNVSHNGHSFFLIMNSTAQRDALIALLLECGIEATTHYEPLHFSVAGKRYCGEAQLPVTESLAGRLLRLPVWPGLPTGIEERVACMARLVCTAASTAGDSYGP